MEGIEPEIASIQENVLPPEKNIPKPTTSRAKRKWKSQEETTAQQKPSPAIEKRKKTKKVPATTDPAAVTPK